MSEAKSLPRSIDVAIHVGADDERVVKVEKLPLGRAAALGVAFKGIPGKIAELREHEGVRDVLASVGNEADPYVIGAQLIQFLPEILDVATDSVIEILSIGTGIERDELETVGLDEAAELLSAVLTVNNIGAVQHHLKNAARSLGFLQETPEAPTTRKRSRSGSKKR